jgi:hypothetical protein
MAGLSRLAADGQANEGRKPQIPPARQRRNQSRPPDLKIEVEDEEEDEDEKLALGKRRTAAKAAAASTPVPRLWR